MAASMPTTSTLGTIAGADGRRDDLAWDRKRDVALVLVGKRRARQAGRHEHQAESGASQTTPMRNRHSALD